MKTPRAIVLSLGFISCSLYLTAQRMGTDPSQPQSPFSSQSPLAGHNQGMSASHTDKRSVSGIVQDTQNNPLKDVRV